MQEEHFISYSYWSTIILFNDSFIEFFFASHSLSDDLQFILAYIFFFFRFFVIFYSFKSQFRENFEQTLLIVIVR